MKRLCCSKYIFLVVFLSGTLFAALSDKSAMIYYGKNLSYPMIGLHDYIVVNSNNVNTDTHGFGAYKSKMYSRIVIKKNINYNDNLSEALNKGFTNFYFENQNDEVENKNFIKFVNSFHDKHPQSKIILSADINIIKSVYFSINAVLLESSLQMASLNQTVEQIKSYGLDIIDVEHVNAQVGRDEVKNLIREIKLKKMIPYVSNYDLDIYGKSSKNAIKREILTLIDESDHDRMILSAHQHGAIALEYMGYIQKLHDVNNGLPNVEKMNHYAGVVIWLSKEYKSPAKLIRWVLSLHKQGVKVAFVNGFGASVDSMLLKQLDIDVYDGDTSPSNKKKITYRDEMIGFEIEPSLSDESLYLQPQNSKAILTYEDMNGLASTPSAITPWGGYAMSESFMQELNEENIWIINPFKFFQEALRLKEILVPDVTTENGNRLLFSHIDGDGIMNYVESNPELFSGDMILDKILKPYKIPHSVSIIGAEVAANGLYPKLSDQLVELAKKIYRLDNVEGATHTFTHPFIWSQIKNGDLDEKYRLKPKGYKFSLEYEFVGTLKYVNEKLSPANKKKANTVFWSGDCAPTEEVLKYAYSKKILNVNGGYTVISNASPWLTNVAPIGLERGVYYQIYTGAENENVYTNDWLGPFWGFKKVVQTFKLTNSPRRLKPIDVYYHLYSGSKTASLNALKYIFDWAIKQEVTPIFTSEYIPKAMDYYTVSMANDADVWLVEGMIDLKTLRIEKKDASIDLGSSRSVVGLKHFENHTYLSLDDTATHLIKTSTGDAMAQRSYLTSSNAKIVDYKNGIKNQQITFDGHVALKLNFHMQAGCRLESSPKASTTTLENQNHQLYYDDAKKATVNVLCQ